MLFLSVSQFEFNHLVFQQYINAVFLQQKYPKLFVVMRTTSLECDRVRTINVAPCKLSYVEHLAGKGTLKCKTILLAFINRPSTVQ